MSTGHLVQDLDLDFVIQSFKMAVLLVARFLRQINITHICDSTLYEEIIEIAEKEAGRLNREMIEHRRSP